MEGGGGDEEALRKEEGQGDAIPLHSLLNSSSPGGHVRGRSGYTLLVLPPFVRSGIDRGIGSGSQTEKLVGLSHTPVHDDGEPCRFS